MSTDWTKVSPNLLTLWYQKLAYHRFEDDLTSDELEARKTYRIVTAILDLADPPSVQGYYSKTINEYHKLWLQNLPLFERIGHIETVRDFTTGAFIYKLWLLSDWIDTDNIVRRRRAAYEQQSQDWLKQRVAYWRVYKTCKSLGIADQKIKEILDTAAVGLKQQSKTTLDFLTSLGLVPITRISDADVAEFLATFQFKPGHTYIQAWDFTAP